VIPAQIECRSGQLTPWGAYVRRRSGSLLLPDEEERALGHASEIALKLRDPFAHVVKKKCRFVVPRDRSPDWPRSPCSLLLFSFAPIAREPIEELVLCALAEWHCRGGLKTEDCKVRVE
jgi:hypothetical protein